MTKREENDNLYEHMEQMRVLGWHKFMGGFWQKEIPTKQGDYPIATRDGHFAGYRSLVTHPQSGKLFDPNTIGGTQEGSDWKGWWWSQPMPEFPMPPDWE